MAFLLVPAQAEKSFTEDRHHAWWCPLLCFLINICYLCQSIDDVQIHQQKAWLLQAGEWRHIWFLLEVPALLYARRPSSMAGWGFQGIYYVTYVAGSEISLHKCHFTRHDIYCFIWHLVLRTAVNLSSYLPKPPEILTAQWVPRDVWLVLAFKPGCS